MTSWARGSLTFFLLALAGCTQHHDFMEPEVVDSGPPPAPGTTVMRRIGSEGGAVELGSLTLRVPRGALPAAEDIRITVTADSAPTGFTAFTPVYRFEPAGLRFERPVEISIPYTGSSRIATIFWTTSGTTSYAPLETRVDGARAIGSVTHFSSAFVGTSCEGPGCCRRATGDLDVLFVIDNSNSMSEEQASLAVELPRMARILASGDIDEDGTQDFPAVRSLNLGVVTTDMGTGGYPVPTCDEPSFGDDGILRTIGNTEIPGCMATYPAFHHYAADVAGADPAAFARDAECVLRTGIGGCGFEQQLEASLKAIAPSTMPLTFSMGTVGHGDRANAGLVRTGSALAVINVTDEEDCSAADPGIFDPFSSTYTGDLNVRCFMYPEAVHPVIRYVDNLLAMRSADPSLLTYATISGVPADLVSDPSAVDYAAILADDRMQERMDASSPTPRLVPSCNVEGRGMAFPPRRLVQTAQQLDARGAHTVVQSICQSDYSPVIRAILERVASSLSGECSE